MEAVAQSTDDATRLAEKIQRLRQQLADTGLAVGTGDTDQIKGAARLTVETPGDGRELASQPSDRDQYRTVGMHARSAFGLKGNGGSAAGDGIGDMHATVLLSTRHARNRSPGRTLRLSRVSSRMSTPLSAAGSN